MKYEQTVEIPQNRRPIIDLPREMPAGKGILTVTSAAEPVEPNQTPAYRLSERFAGSLRVSDERYAEMQKSLREGRDEWNRNIF
jgi:hypothetical protein